MQSKKRKPLFWSIPAATLLAITLIFLADNVQAIPAYIPPSHVTVRMYRLVSPAEAQQNPLLRVGEIHPSGALCSAQSIVYGCTAFEGNSKPNVQLLGGHQVIYVKRRTTKLQVNKHANGVR